MSSELPLNIIQERGNSKLKAQMEKCTNVKLNSDIAYNDSTITEPIQTELTHVIQNNLELAETGNAESLRTVSKKSEKQTILDSDSEGESDIAQECITNTIEEPIIEIESPHVIHTEKSCDSSSKINIITPNVLKAENSNVGQVVFKKHKNRTILDSDSESESDIVKEFISNTIEEPIQMESPHNVIHTEKLCDSSSKINITPTVSEAENELLIKGKQNILELAGNSNVEQEVSKKHKNRTILDSDSESESDIAKEFISNTIEEPIQIKSPHVIHTEKFCDSSSKINITSNVSEAENELSSELSIKGKQNNLELKENSNVEQVISEKHKNWTILDSDSESEAQNELSINGRQNNLELAENGHMEQVVSKKHKNRTILDSDSESESDITKELTNTITKENEVKEFSSDKIRKRIAFVDTDSETEDIVSHNKSFISVTTTEYKPSDGETESTNASYKTDYACENVNIYKRISSRNSDSKSKDDGTHNKDFNFNNDSEISEGVPSTETSTQKSRLAMLCDSDSDEIEGEVLHGENSILNKNMQFGEKTTKKKKANKADSETTKKMTPKEAAKLRTEIQSESQRMMREKNVSLPYHKPKAHSLKEFLTRRPRLAIAVSRVQAPPSVAIKMSTEQLEIISKKMKEREIEVKQFYQSESESASDEDTAVPTGDTNKLDEEANQTSKCLQDQDNKNDDGINTLDLEDVTKTTAEDDSQKEKLETESVLPNHVDTQNTETITSCMDECSGNVQDFIDETATTDKPTLEDEPMETNDVPQTDPGQPNMESQSRGESPISDNMTQQISTENYDFHLDDENTEKLISSNNTLVDNQQSSNLKDNLETSESEQVPETLEPETGLSELAKEPSSKRFIYSDLDIEIENFGNSENIQGTSEDEILPPVKSKLDILKEKLANIKPRLSGGPDKVIDLDSILAKPKGVVELMERFTKHAATKKHHNKHKVKLSIVTVESGGDIHKETVAVNVESDDEDVVREEIPGAKFKRLRGELQKQMDQKKSEIWRQKAARGMRENEETNKDGGHIENDEKDSIYYDEEEEEAEMTEGEDTDEEFENEIELTDKPRKKSAFLDQEAEESDDGEIEHKEDYEDGILNEEETMEGSEGKESEHHVEDDEDSNMANEQTPSAPEAQIESSVEGKRILRRILKPDDDSDEEDLFNDSIIQNTTSVEQLDSTVTADEEDIPPHQTRHLETPMRQQALSQMKSISDFLTPISFITSIQNLASANKGNKYGPAISPFRMPDDRSPTTEERSALSQSQKKLFTDSEVMDSQESLGTPVTQTGESSIDVGQHNETDSLQKTQLEVDEEPPSTQDLMGICSGEFTGVTQLEPSNDTMKFNEFGGTQSSELKSLGTDQDMVISQLLDEEELENFKKKFESPVNPTTQRSVSNETQEFTGGGILDSDDEDNEECGLRKRKNQRRIQFSDDENSDEENNESAEEIDLQDNDHLDDEEIDNIGYDSEENEVDLNDIGKKKIRMTDFLEAEAELSESDWDSEDEEDNDDMDKLEFELGDTDKFDEQQVKDDLEKIHLRRMLDDDAREVKLLQEVLLEDGEMHGTGRQRQFKWKNIDVNDQTEENKNEDDIFLDIEESEEEWRKKRHEREMFLKEKQHKSQQPECEDDLLNHSQLLKIGQKVLQRSRSQNNSAVESTNDVAGEPVGKIPFSLLSKRGSFLSRSDQVLQRLADYTKITAEFSLNSTKTTKNFVFQSAAASEVSIAAADIKKRKASEGTPNVIKKLRLDTTFTPNEKKMERSKKLFNF